MKRTSRLLITCYLIATGCLLAGYSLSGIWLIVPLILVVSLALALARKYSAVWSAAFLLFSYLILAAVGVAIGLPLTWMLLASISTLVCWDLMHFKQEAGAEQAQKSTALLENIHLQALAVAVATGLVFSLISANITIQLPFIAVAALTVTAVGGLAYGMHLLAK